MLGSSIGSYSSPFGSSNTQSRAEYADSQRADQGSKSSRTEQSSPSVDATSSSSRAESFDVDALVNQIWGFASNRIANAESDGASTEKLDNLWDAARSGVSQGFGEAKDVLDDLGMLDDDLAMKIDSAYGQLMDKLEARDLDSNVTSSVAEQGANEVSSGNRSISMYQYERQTFSLSVTTAQGDRIEIRSVAEQSASLEDSRFGSQSSSIWGSSQQSEFSLFIKGDLNEQELLDLDKLLAEVNELAEEFYNGDYQTAFEMASDLNIGGSSLRSLDLSMQEIEQKGAAVYSAAQDEPTSLPKGLSPLKDYAEKLMQAHEQWQQAFNSTDGLLQALENHPLNDGDLLKTSTLLM